MILGKFVPLAKFTPSLRHVLRFRMMHEEKKQVVSGLHQFFENGSALPPFDPAKRVVYGRAWSADELRRKSFEDLHRLWFVLLKEMNLLSTQEAEAARAGQRWFGMHRAHKCRLGMARIKTVLTERQKLYNKAKELTETSSNAIPTAGDLILEACQNAKMKQLRQKRKFRKRMNYRTGRRAMFV